MSDTATRNLNLLSDRVLATLREDPSLLHRMPESAWDATRYVVDVRWRFLSEIGTMPKDEAQAFTLWYSGVREGVRLMYACGSTMDPSAVTARTEG
jgi:hypothetical protein